MVTGRLVRFVISVAEGFLQIRAAFGFVAVLAFLGQQAVPVVVCRVVVYHPHDLLSTGENVQIRKRPDGRLGEWWCRDQIGGRVPPFHAALRFHVVCQLVLAITARGQVVVAQRFTLSQQTVQLLDFG